ncbi:MAG: hypothetical protein VKM98_09260, partial [Cyanobacteriota bacterium]|nr:hypothetical protein [Cyanobacteriota bacterium]
MLALLVSLVLSGFGIYRSWRERSLGAVLGRAGLAWLVLVSMISVGSTRLRLQTLVEHHHLLPWALLLLCWLLISHTGSRLVLRRLRAIGQNSRRDGYIGSREGLWHLRRRIRRDPWRGHRIVAAITWPRASGPDNAVLQAIQQFAKGDAIDQWIVEDPGQAEALAPLLKELAQHTCPVLLIPAWLRDHHLTPQPAQVAGLPALQLWDTEATPLKLK